MLKRYPDIGRIDILTEGNDVSGISDTTTKSVEIKGRYEPNTNKSSTVDYKGKFYSRNLNYIKQKFIDAGVFTDNIIPFKLDGYTLVLNDRQFVIIQVQNYQTHCEIWLE